MLLQRVEVGTGREVGPPAVRHVFQLFLDAPLRYCEAAATVVGNLPIVREGGKHPEPSSPWKCEKKCWIMSEDGLELGCKISLISKAGIRYEGRLFTVDPDQCTIALSGGKNLFLLCRVILRAIGAQLKRRVNCRMRTFPGGNGFFCF